MYDLKNKLFESTISTLFTNHLSVFFIFSISTIFSFSVIAFNKISYFDKTKFKNYLTVSNEDPALLKKVVDGKITLTKALRKLGKVKDNKKYNPDRHNFFKTLDKYPDITKNAIDSAFKMIHEFRSIGNGIIFDKDMGWEPNQITAPLSNILIIMWLFSSLTSMVIFFSKLLSFSAFC